MAFCKIYYISLLYVVNYGKLLQKACEITVDGYIMERFTTEKNSKEQKEIELLYMEYRLKLLQFIMATISNREIAEDIVQEVFLEAVRRHDEFSAHPHKIGWLYRTARYKIMECMRRLKQTELLAEKAEQLENTEEGFSRAEMEMTLYETLTTDELLRFRRYFVWGQNIEEIAQKEQVSENNMRVRLSRLKKKIMDAFL